MEPPSGPPQVRISSHQVNPRSQAHQHLLEQDYPRAIRELEALWQRAKAEIRAQAESGGPGQG